MNSYDAMWLRKINRTLLLCSLIKECDIDIMAVTNKTTPYLRGAALVHSMEEQLLRYLLDHPVGVQPAAALFRVIWPDDDIGGYGLRPEQQDRLRRLVYQLRQHTEPDPRNPRFVVTAHGVGYALYPEQDLAVR